MSEKVVAVKPSINDLFDTVSAHNKSAVIELLIALGPRAGEKSGYSIAILGKDSDEARKFRNKQFNSWRIKAQTLRKMGRDIDMDSAEVTDEKAIEVLTNLTTGWSDNWPDKFSKEAVSKIYADYPDIKRQMDEAASAPANF